MENFNNTLQEIINKKKAEAGDSFSIMYRTDPGSSELEYSEYFLDQLETRQGKELDQEKEIDMRTNPITWELFLERDFFTIGQHPIDKCYGYRACNKGDTHGRGEVRRATCRTSWA